MRPILAMVIFLGLCESFASGQIVKEVKNYKPGDLVVLQPDLGKDVKERPNRVKKPLVKWTLCEKMSTKDSLRN